ncbi:MAG: YggS family pyridoxal phosphate enzyme [Omnitrophica WOR_2 bacterium RIFCSPHIGHO2_02_FULL_52_10]|nr:MAG: YggS family pyridoxal phosphate enzyme [Omnitrophica WOR_2 bacterium RIFCSPHIGHO2_02_FULL_52_10]
MIRENVARILGRLGEICARLGRDPREVVLVGVTKYAEVAAIREAIGAGLAHIGENKVQDAGKKFPLIGDAIGKVTKHMIGHLQTNKVKQCLEIFDFIQSVDSVKLANVIEAQAAKLNKRVDVLVQVNTAGEEQKFGIPLTEAFPLIEEVSRLRHIQLLGLMTMAPFGADEKALRQCFRGLRLLRDKAVERFSGAPNIAMQYLSMGMTDDFEIALEEGSNMVRIGRAIFSDQ